jgi:8-oxo-dGTP pyrophosphatase MutT (NUDIX family)
VNILEKVTAFVTRGDGPAHQLLVFRHPTAGIQVPAGTVEPNESPEAAGLREVTEETGLTDVRLIARLATFQHHMAADQRVFLCRAPVYAEPANIAPLVRIPCRRGIPVTVTDERSDYAHIVYEEFDLRSGEVVVTRRDTGWVPVDTLTTHVVGHLFHLRSTASTPERWTVLAEIDLGLTFELFWVPLSPRPALVEGQAAWLDRVYDHLL